MERIVFILRKRIFFKIVITVTDICRSQEVSGNVKTENIVLLKVRINLNIDSPFICKEELQFLLIPDDYRDVIDSGFLQLSDLPLNQCLSVLHKKTFRHRKTDLAFMSAPPAKIIAMFIQLPLFIIFAKIGSGENVKSSILIVTL